MQETAYIVFIHHGEPRGTDLVAVASTLSRGKQLADRRIQEDSIYGNLPGTASVWSKSDWEPLALEGEEPGAWRRYVLRAASGREDDSVCVDIQAVQVDELVL